ncbi:hypothetical protein TNIN_393471 [Trichonephila inaurata madagascariensis]|uniref:Uncharacterized protein n=1 Tax=Trichonephila inaurata madagascariensis TaxID=2747483 RepID=A0A8X6YIK0_9ARAC|nr:hypothetical protein TNIN_393471 [Trichonephila inaurata madagascariensis]
MSLVSILIFKDKKYFGLGLGSVPCIQMSRQLCEDTVMFWDGFSSQEKADIWIYTYKKLSHCMLLPLNLERTVNLYVEKQNLSAEYCCDPSIKANKTRVFTVEYCSYDKVLPGSWLKQFFILGDNFQMWKSFRRKFSKLEKI